MKFIYAQGCNGPVKTYQTYTYSWDENCPDISVKSDRNEYFNSGCGGPCAQKPSTGFELDMPAYSTDWTAWNSCIGASGVPTPNALYYSFTIQSVTWDFSGGNSSFLCCEDYFEGIFANLGDASNPGSGAMNVALDAADNNDCGASGGHHTYTEEAGAGTNGTWEAALPYTATGFCTDPAKYNIRETTGFDVIPSFLTEDAEAAGCFACETGLSAGFINVEFDATVGYVICDKDFSSPYSSGSPCVGDPGICATNVVSIESLEKFSINVKEIEDDRVAVNWRVESDDPLERFEVFRSTDGFNFEKFRDVKAAFDEEAYANNYATLDYNTLPGRTYYYKVLVYDGKGNMDESETKSITTKRSFDDKVRISPVPVRDHLSIQWIDDPDKFNPLDIKLLDITGRTLMQEKLLDMSSNISINSLNLPDGYYLLEISDGARRREVRSIIIEN